MAQAVGYGAIGRRGRRGGFRRSRSKHWAAAMLLLTVSAVVAILAVGLIDPADVPGLTAPSLSLASAAAS